MKLPQSNAYLSVLRGAMTMDTLDEPGIYVGTSGGHLFASADARKRWELALGSLPPIYSLEAVVAD